MGVHRIRVKRFVEIICIFFERADIVRPAPPLFSCRRIGNGAIYARY